MSSEPKTAQTPNSGTTSSQGVAAPSKGIRLTGLLSDAGVKVQVELKPDAINTLYDQSSADGSKLLRSLLAESQDHLSALLGKELPQTQKLLAWDQISGLKPAVLLDPADLLQRGELTVGEFFGVNDFLDARFEKEARPVCGKASCGSYKRTPAQTAADCLSKLSGQEDSRNLLLCVTSPFSKAQLSFFANSGVSRFVYKGEYFRLSDEDPRNPGALRKEDEARLDSLAKAKEKPKGKAEDLLFALLRVLSVKSLSEESLEKELTSAHRDHPSITLLLQKQDKSLVPILESRLGYSCSKCSLNFPPAVAESYEYRGLSREEWGTTPLQDLLSLDEEAGVLLLPLKESGLGHLSLQRKLKDLSAGERTLCCFARALTLGYEELLILCEHPTTRLDGSARKLLESLAERLLKQGNLLVQTAAPEKTPPLEPDLPIPFTELVSGKKAPSPSKSSAKSTSEKATSAKKASAAKTSEKPKQEAKIELKPGELHLLLGPNNSGKTQFLHSLLRKQASSREGGKRKAGTQKQIHLNGELELSALRRKGKTRLLSQLGIAEPLARLYASLPQARKRGLSEKALRIDLSENFCPRCSGLGRLASLTRPHSSWPLCGDCLGFSFRDEPLEVSFQGKTLGALFALSLQELLALFQHHESISGPLFQACLLSLGTMRGGVLLEECSPSELLRLSLSPILAAVRSSAGATKSLILLDETLDFLSPGERLTLLEVLAECASSGCSILLTSRSGIPDFATAQKTFLSAPHPLALLSTASVPAIPCCEFFF